MKTAHFLWLGWLALAVVGSANAAPLLTGHFEAGDPGVTLTGPPAQAQGNSPGNSQGNNQGNNQGKGQNNSFSFVHVMHSGELEDATISSGKITLRFGGNSENGSNGRFNLSIGGRLIAQGQEFAESIEVTFNPTFLVDPEFTNPTVLIERTNAAGSVLFQRSQLEFWGSASAPSSTDISADVTPIPTPGSLLLLVAGLLATGLLVALALVRRRWRGTRGGGVF